MLIRVVNILMICLHEARVCFNIPEKVRVYLRVHRHGEAAPGGAPASQRACAARLARLAVSPQEVTQKSRRNVCEHLKSPRTCGLT